MKTPINWLVCKMQEIASIYNGNSISEEVKFRDFTGLSNGYNYIATKDIGFDSIINYENGVKIPFARKDFKIAPKNTPLLCIEGGSAGRKLGFLSEDVCFGNKLCAFVSPLSRWIYYYLQSHLFRNHFNTNKKGLIGGVSINKLKQISIPVPPLAEQKRIVKKIEELFGVIDEQVKRLEATQEALVSYRQSILQQAFSGHQIIKKVKDVGNVVTGSTPSTTHPEYYGDEYPFYKPTDLNQGYSTDKAVNYVSQKGFDVSRQLPEKSVLVTCIGATIGKTGLIHQKGICNQQINAIIPSKEYLSEFVYFYAISPQFQNAIKLNASATTLPILNKKNFEQLPFPYLSLPEQKAIVEKIETAFAFADKAQAAITDALEQAKQLKQSILKRAFEGKLVPQDPNDKPIDLTQLKKDKQK